MTAKLRTYWVDYQNENHMDRDCHIKAEDPKHALHRFNMEYGPLTITDFIDVTDSDNWKSVIYEIHE